MINIKFPKWKFDNEFLKKRRGMMSNLSIKHFNYTHSIIDSL